MSSHEIRGRRVEKNDISYLFRRALKTGNGISYLRMPLPTPSHYRIQYFPTPFLEGFHNFIHFPVWPTPLGFCFVLQSLDRPRGAGEMWARSLTGLWTRTLFCPTTSSQSYGVIWPKKTFLFLGIKHSRNNRTNQKTMDIQTSTSWDVVRVVKWWLLLWVVVFACLFVARVVCFAWVSLMML